ncbi:hypothetical protein JXQ31_02995 [candidate division KSB1 bacterium]|nr:hypothetical protein [candidate division KSB1 bacterium]
MIPKIDGDWWQIAGNPDLGQYTSEKQQPVDFGIWQASDGTWQLWSCIRHTNCGGNTRLFYRWEGKSLTDENWVPMGIAMEADTSFGEAPGGLQAPFVIQENNDYYMFYGDWGNICLAKSSDGKSFTRVLNEKNSPALFSGPYSNTRDPMVVKIRDLYYIYYMGHNKDIKPHSAIFCRTSTDKLFWSEPVMVSAGGRAGTMSDWWGGDAECPFVLYKGGLFYLFRNQRYGEDNLNTQYCSPNPLNFGVDDDRYYIGTLKVAAPEIIHHDGQDYIAALLPGLDGIRIAKLDWEPGKK